MEKIDFATSRWGGWSAAWSAQTETTLRSLDRARPSREPLSQRMPSSSPLPPSPCHASVSLAYHFRQLASPPPSPTSFCISLYVFPSCESVRTSLHDSQNVLVSDINGPCLRCHHVTPASHCSDQRAIVSLCYSACYSVPLALDSLLLIVCLS